jgi:DNA-binding transcriptional ArsR family regulator
MAIRFRLENDNVRALRFAVSPLCEAVMSLNALIFPRERGLQHGWIRAMRELPAPLRRELTAFSFVLDFAVPDCILPTPGRRTAASWDDELARVAALAPAEAGYELARPAFHYALETVPGPAALERADVRELVEHRAARYGPGAVATARLAWSDPERLLRRFVDLLQAYWQRAFADEWRQLGPRLENVARRDARTVLTRGVYAVLDGRFADTVVDPEAGWFQRNSPHDHEVRPSRRRPVTFVPSVYVWPHVRVNCDAPWPLAVIYPPADVRADARADPVPETLPRALRALAEPTRLQLLRVIAARPRSTEELAHLVGLSSAGTSKNLARLAGAGLVRRRRDGYYVLYELAPGGLAAVADTLLAYVGSTGDDGDACETMAGATGGEP